MSHFDRFWKAYPKKEAKPTARKKFEALDAETQLLICEHVEERVTKDAKWIEGFIPMPTTFLNNGRWEDEYQTVSMKRVAETTRRESPPKELCPGCRSYSNTARHEEICINHQPYYDLVVDGKPMLLKDGGVHEIHR